MHIGLVEQPADGSYRVQLDEGDLIPGYIKKNPRNERWFVKFRRKDKLLQLRTEPHSREAAAMLLVFHHFEEERKAIEAQTRREETDGASKMP